MARRALARGEFGEVKLSGLVEGRWVKEETVKAEKLRPSRWRATVLYQDGKAKRPRPLSAEDTAKERARTRISVRMEQETTKSAAPELGRRTLEQGVRQYLEGLEAGKPKRSPSTVRTYRQVVNSYVLRESSLISGMALADITPLDLMREAQAMGEEGMASHVHHAKAIWSAVFREAVLAGAVTVNPVRLMEPLELEKPKGRTHSNGAAHDTSRVLTEEESSTLLRKVYADPDAARKGIADLLLLGTYQGLRIAEAVSLRWEDLDLESEHPTLTVAGTLQPVKGQGIIWHGTPKSAASRRTIPLVHQDVIDMLRRRRDERAMMPKHRDREVQKIRDAHVFLSPKGRIPNVDNVNKDVRTALDGAGFPWLTYHGLRHTLSVRLKQRGVPAVTAARFLGHTEAVNAATYSDRATVPMQVLEVADRLALPSA
ncbi:tyrosine-type recombinase/integrase [Brachybacterium sp. MASK1Z-5]|uniref:Tyrosine-type recombinase/integrase n=1 Tax=Brachybacterium halotolerans TaxID=2795215 RepID=A0ABS1B680_9MICO|nr:tyrosine-type recombinase/integrase [Brachybacterium halotolerans]MBK0330119.1 tyrosine-type recombinase/integrase [Brachybacterium halotolerans]